MKPLLSTEVLQGWLRARRYDVTPAMIEAATERRLAGDWRGACAAVNVDVGFDPEQLTTKSLRDGLLSDLAVLAPDLLRWYLPANWRSTAHSHWWVHGNIVLASYGGGKRKRHLYVERLWRGEFPGRPRLRFGGLRPERSVLDWSLSRHLWDATRVDELRERFGGSSERTPFFHPDGTRLTDAELPDTDPGDADQAARTEWLTVMLRDPARTVEALGAAGIELVTRYKRLSRQQLEWISRLPVILTRLEPEVRPLGPQCLMDRHTSSNSFVLTTKAKGLVLQWDHHRAANDLPTLSWPAARWLPDTELLLAGRLTPHDLHPLVRSSLFPKLADDGNPPIFELEPVRVRCHGVWHIVEHRDGVLTVPHTEEEHRRERTLQSLGGGMYGCSRALQGWLDGGPLPRRLREQRRTLFSRMVYGDTDGVIELLDQGLDPRVRDGLKRNLLHYLSFVDHDRLLDRLLAAGVDLDGADHKGRTPLCLAVHDRASVAFIRALLAAGARTDVVDHAGKDLRYHILRSKNKDLRFLLDEVDRTHDELGRTDVEPKRRR